MEPIFTREDAGGTSPSPSPKYRRDHGIDRLLNLLERNNIKASWFVPARSIESFPEQVQKIKDANHVYHASRDFSARLTMTDR
jgi:hypothetical protein